MITTSELLITLTLALALALALALTLSLTLTLNLTLTLSYGWPGVLRPGAEPAPPQGDRRGSPHARGAAG